MLMKELSLSTFRRALKSEAVSYRHSYCVEQSYLVTMPVLSRCRCNIGGAHGGQPGRAVKSVTPGLCLCIDAPDPWCPPTMGWF